MKDYIRLEVRRDPVLTPRLITCLVAFMFIFTTILLIVSN